jgi:hypothetical protein
LKRLWAGKVELVSKKNATAQQFLMEASTDHRQLDAGTELRKP